MKRINKSILLLGMLSLGTASFAQDADWNQTVATLNGEPITLGQILALKSELPDEYTQGDTNEIFKGLVDQISVQKQIAGEATIDERVELKVEAASRATIVSDEVDQFVQDNMTDTYLKAQYDELIGDAPAQTEWQASHILVETEDEAIALKAKADAGEDFATLAAETSTGPSAENGGDLGWFGAGQMVPEFEAAVKPMEKGQVSDPVQTNFGWHIILLVDTRTAEKPSFEEVKPQLEGFAQQKIIDEKINAIREDMTIEINPDFDPELINIEF